MSGPFPGAGSNPQVGGSSASPAGSNPQVGGSQPNTPASGAPAGNNISQFPGSNPPVGASPNGADGNQQAPGNGNQQDDNAPVSADVYRERVRAETALRKRVQELEQKQREADLAALTEGERIKRELEEYRTKEQTWQRERQELRLTATVENYSRERGLVNPAAVRAILLAEYGEQLDVDAEGNYVNAQYLIDRMVEKYDFLKAPATAQPQTPPNAGRTVSPPRTPSGQYAPYGQSAQPNTQPQAPSQWPRLSDIDWSKPHGQ